VISIILSRKSHPITGIFYEKEMLPVPLYLQEWYDAHSPYTHTTHPVE
jgi:hypothetical protein